jgi:N-methylhydantoinase A/oxoprolinase/acetone carboxylase beta subunit
MAEPGDRAEMKSLGIDIGGTFTDVVCAGPQGVISFKVPTTRGDPSRAVEQALAMLRDSHGVPSEDIIRFAHGTTVATNAVIERQGARVGLITTQGFRDTLEIGRQMRHQLYDLRLKPETPGWLAPGARRVEVTERVAADGSVVTPLDESSLAQAIAALKAAEVQAVAICLLFSFVNPSHERRIAEALAEALPSIPVSLSSEVDPVFREYERTVATAFDAYIKPVVDDYLGRMEQVLEAVGVPAPLQVMQSRGGLAAASVARRRPVRLFLSGPAAGVIGACAEGTRAGIGDLITIDIGGTSSDIALVRSGTVGVRNEVEISGYAVRVPMLDVVTLGAGGGSVAWRDAAGGLRVGPRSAGAEPGPACYGRGGEEPAVTDASVVLGYVDPAYFAGGTLPLEPALARHAVTEKIAGPMGLNPEAAAAGIHRIANARIVDGIRLVSLNRGHDPRDFALVPLGGAGGLHATALAEELGIRRILVPQSPGVLSAAGLLSATIEHEVTGPYHRKLTEADIAEIKTVFHGLHAQAAALMARESAGDLTIQRLTFADLAYAGQSHYIEVPFDSDFPDALTRAYRNFEAEHERINGHATGAPVKIVNLRAVHRAALPDPFVATDPTPGPSLKGTRPVWFGASAVETAIHDRTRIAPGDVLDGPVIVEQADSTTLIPPGWRAEALPHGALVLTHGEDHP